MEQNEIRLPFRWISPAGCLIAFVGFFLVFTEVTCNGKQIDTITGVELATGYSADVDLVQNDSNTEIETQNEKGDPNIFALNAWIAALLGLILFIIPRMRDQHLLHALTAAIGLGCMIGLMINLQSELIKAKNKNDAVVNIDLDLQFNMQPGFWLVTLAFLVTLIADIMQLRAARAKVQPEKFTDEPSAGV